MASAKFHQSFRQYHRWLGFFLAGIMAVYASSGVLLIFRGTDFLKYDQDVERTLDAQLSGKEVVEQLRMRGLEVTEENDQQIVLNKGQYDKQTGVAVVTIHDYPKPISKMVKLHKATHNSPLYWLNITFGVSLLFFVVSAFLMFLPKLPMFKSGLKIAAGGIVFALLMVIFGS